MQTLWLKETPKYTGEQLSPLFNYLNHGLLGDSMVSWAGACDVPFEHMIDGEDLRASSKIQGDHMLHFVLELFQMPLSTAVALQRLMGELLMLKVGELGAATELTRKGDDVYWGTKKLNISIATCSHTSSLIHFAVNITNEGTPVETAALSDFKITEIEKFAQSFMESLKAEVLGIKRAMVKVRSF